VLPRGLRITVWALVIATVGALLAGCSTSRTVAVGKPAGKECSPAQLGASHPIRPGPRGTLRGTGDCIASLAGVVWPGFSSGDANAPSARAVDAIPVEAARLKDLAGVDFVDLPINAGWWLTDKRMAALRGVPYVAYVEQVVQWITGAGVYVGLAPVLGGSPGGAGNGPGGIGELEAFWESAAYRFAGQPGVLYQLWWTPPAGGASITAEAAGLVRQVRRVDETTTLIVTVGNTLSAAKVKLSGLTGVVLAIPTLAGASSSSRNGTLFGELCAGVPSSGGSEPQRELAAWMEVGSEGGDTVMAGPMGSCTGGGEILPIGNAFSRGSALALRAKLPVLIGDADTLVAGLDSPGRAGVDPGALRLTGPGKTAAKLFHQLR